MLDRRRRSILLHQLWSRSSWWLFLLAPVEFLYKLLWRARRAYYQARPAKPKVHLPIIVVGSIVVGGAGKTPAVIMLAAGLLQRGLKVGIVSRGYKGGKSRRGGMEVNHRSRASESGDEPLLLARRTGCPVYVHSDRNQAARQLVMNHNLDVILSDDGLQHHAMYRNVEIAVLDASSGLGNGRCLPAGPLREPPARLKQVDYLLVNCLNHGEMDDAWFARFLPSPTANLHKMALKRIYLRRLGEKTTKTVSQWQKMYRGRKIHAIAGIAQPHHFFATLERVGLVVEPHIFANHHAFKRADFVFAKGAPIILTEKDAVKCEDLTDLDLWALCREAKVDKKLIINILSQLSQA